MAAQILKLQSPSRRKPRPVMIGRLLLDEKTRVGTKSLYISWPLFGSAENIIDSRLRRALLSPLPPPHSHSDSCQILISGRYLANLHCWKRYFRISCSDDVTQLPVVCELFLSFLSQWQVLKEVDMGYLATTRFTNWHCAGLHLFGLCWLYIQCHLTTMTSLCIMRIIYILVSYSVYHTCSM